MAGCEGLGSLIRSLQEGPLETEIDLGFFAADWSHNLISVIRTGTPVSPGQIGPHLLLPGTYNVTVYRYMPDGWVREVGVTIFVNRTTGVIQLKKAPIVDSFDGRVVINYARPQ